jgi:hypothetical protein
MSQNRQSTDDGPQSNGTSVLGLLRAGPAVARFGVSAALHLTQWGAETSVHGVLRVARAASRGESPADLLEAAIQELRDSGRRLLGVPEIESPARIVTRERTEPAGRPVARAVAATPDSLRARGAELLRLSADLGFSEESHPAYARILGELAPDEARILRLLACEGPQPAVDVRTSRPLNVGSRLVAPGLTMIGMEAGVRHLDRVHAYLSNLYRLGLIWFSREPLGDTLRYQVLEVQKDIKEAKQKAGRAHTVRRSIQLTTFGEDFCQMCLPLRTGELETVAAPEAPPVNGAEAAGRAPKARSRSKR